MDTLIAPDLIAPERYLRSMTRSDGDAPAVTEVEGLARSTRALAAAIRGGGRTVLVVNTRSRKGRRHWPRLPARLAAAGLAVQAALPVHHPAELPEILTRALEPAARVDHAGTARRSAGPP
jgi:hypothetical protein